MSWGTSRLSAVVVVTAFFLSTTLPARAEIGTATISGAVTDATGKPAANAKVTAKNADSGETKETHTDSAGAYSFASLPPGNYEISAYADGVNAGIIRLVAAAGSQQTANLSLTVGEPAQQASPAASSPASTDNLPNAPSSTQTQLSLGDLGFSPAESQADAQRQALLDKRTHMLKIHQRMGLITAAPLVATVITSMNAGGRNTSSASRDLHVALGSLTGDLYGITAYYAIRAPRIPGTETRGPIRVHKILAWIHGPGMIATPILGAMAFNQRNNGERVHGIAQAHGPVAIITAGAFGAALLSVSAKF